MRTDLGTANFIGPTATISNKQYIRVSRLCWTCPDLFDEIVLLQKSEPLHSFQQATPLSMKALADSRLEPRVKLENLNSVEAAYYAHDKYTKRNQRKEQFNLETIYGNCMETRSKLNAFHDSLCERFKDLALVEKTFK